MGRLVHGRKSGITRSEESQPPGGKVTIRPHLIEGGGSSEKRVAKLWGGFSAGGRDELRPICQSCGEDYDSVAQATPCFGAELRCRLVGLARHCPRACCRNVSLAPKGSLGWSRRVGSNHRPAVYETAALPTELRRPSMSCEETGWIGRGIDGIILSTSITCQSSDSIRRCHLTRASGRVRTWAFASSGGTLIGSCSCPYSALAALGTCVRT